MSNALAALLDDVRCQIRGMLVKGVVRLVTEATGLRVLQVTGRAWDETTPETWPDAQHWEPAGFSCAPLSGAEALVLQLTPDLAIVAVVTDRRYRPKDCSAGETTIYDQTTPGAAQQRIRLRPGVGIAINAPLGVNVTGGLTATTVRSGDGITGVWTGNDGETMTFAGGIVVACTPPAV